MFERYTEKARRVVFFARYEASQYGSAEIDSEHLLLGLLREVKSLRKSVPLASADWIRQQVEAHAPRLPSTSTSVDLPLSDDSRKILKAAADVADTLAHRQIGTEHLLLGMLAVPNTLAAQLLAQCGANDSFIRTELARQPSQDAVFLLHDSKATRPRRSAFPPDTIEIHGTRRNADYIRDVVSLVRSYNYHWEKTTWRARDIVIHHKNGAFSFDLTLVEDNTKFTLVKQGWKKDHCFICRWELFESDDEHGTGYTNGRTWTCVECCERFVLGDFFSSSYSEIT